MEDVGSVGPWQLHRRLGAGGMGVVYEATRNGGRPCALKLLLPGWAADPAFRTRFAREITIAKRVRGAHVVRVIDYDLDGPQPWMATELLDGRSLSEVVQGAGALSGERLLSVAHGMALGLRSLHEGGVVHRDIKPSNIVMATRGPVIIDFGVAAAAELTSITATGVRVGSAGWMAPEQITGDPVTGATDTFGFGLTLAYAATGISPFGTGPSDALVHRILQGRADLSRVPTEWQALVAACLVQHPAARPTDDDLERATRSYRDLEAVSQHIATTLQLTPEATVVEASPPTLIAVPPRRRRRLSWAVTAAVGAFAVGIAGFVAAQALGWPHPSAASSTPPGSSSTPAARTPHQPTRTGRSAPPLRSNAPSAAPSTPSAPSIPAGLTYTASVAPGKVCDVSRFVGFLTAHANHDIALDVSVVSPKRSTFDYYPDAGHGGGISMITTGIVPVSGPCSDGVGLALALPPGSMGYDSATGTLKGTFYDEGQVPGGAGGTSINLAAPHLGQPASVAILADFTKGTNDAAIGHFFAAHVGQAVGVDLGWWDLSGTNSGMWTDGASALDMDWYCYVGGCTDPLNLTVVGDLLAPGVTATAQDNMTYLAGRFIVKAADTATSSYALQVDPTLDGAVVPIDPRMHLTWDSITVADPTYETGRGPLQLRESAADASASIDGKPTDGPEWTLAGKRLPPGFTVRIGPDQNGAVQAISTQAPRAVGPEHIRVGDPLTAVQQAMGGRGKQLTWGCGDTRVVFTYWPSVRGNVFGVATGTQLDGNIDYGTTVYGMAVATSPARAMDVFRGNGC